MPANAVGPQWSHDLQDIGGNLRWHSWQPCRPMQHPSHPPVKFQATEFVWFLGPVAPIPPGLDSTVPFVLGQSGPEKTMIIWCT